MFINGIPDFGVKKVILNPVDIICRWCKLNFGHLESRYITAVLVKG